MDLLEKHRPKTIEEFVADDTLAARLKATLESLKFQCMLFYGPSGTGKTSFARILADKLGASGLDFREENCGDKTGVDNAREWVKYLEGNSFLGTSRILILDEAHKLTNAAQQCMLKGMEGLNENNYVIICSTDPEQLITTIRTRCGCKINFTPSNLEHARIVKGLGDIVFKLTGLDDGGETADKIISEYLESNSRHTFSVREFITFAISVIESGSGNQLHDIDVVDPMQLIKFFENAKFKQGAVFIDQNWNLLAKKVLALSVPPESCRIRMMKYFTKRFANAEPQFIHYYRFILFHLSMFPAGGPEGEAQLLLALRGAFDAIKDRIMGGVNG